MSIKEEKTNSTSSHKEEAISELEKNKDKDKDKEKEKEKENISDNLSEPYNKKIIIKKEVTINNPSLKNNEYIEKLELENSDNKNEIQALKSKNIELNNKLIENNELIEKYELENSLKENENNKALLILENKVEALTKEKNDLENKTKELLLIVNQYSKELKDLSNKNKILAEENKNFYTQNIDLNDNLKKKMNNINDLQSQNEQLNELISENKKKDEIIEELKNENERMKSEYDNRIKNEEKMNEEIKNLKSKLNENENLKKKYENISADLLSTQNNFKEIQDINDKNLKRAEECETALNNQTININKNIVNLIECINNFFEEEIHLDNNLPTDKNEEVNENNNKDLDFNICPALIDIENIKFNLLLECLKNKKSNLKKYINNLINNHNDTQKVNKENLLKIKDLNKEKNELSRHNEILKEEKNNLLNELNILRSYLNELNDNAINNEKENEILRSQILTISPNKSIFTEMAMRQNTSEKINSLDDDMDIQLLYEEINNLKNENKNLIDTKELLEKELDNIKNNNFDFIFNNPLLHSGNNSEEEKIKFDLVIEKYNKKLFKYEIENNNLKFENQLLQEKLKNLKNENNSYLNNSGYNKSIQKLESQKESLINDNALLIDNNKYLKKELCSLNDEIDKIKYSQNNSQYSIMPKRDYSFNNNDNDNYNNYDNYDNNENNDKNDNNDNYYNYDQDINSY